MNPQLLQLHWGPQTSVLIKENAASKRLASNKCLLCEILNSDFGESSWVKLGNVFHGSVCQLNLRASICA